MLPQTSSKDGKKPKKMLRRLSNAVSSLQNLAISPFSSKKNTPTTSADTTPTSTAPPSPLISARALDESVDLTDVAPSIRKQAFHCDNNWRKNSAPAVIVNPLKLKKKHSGMDAPSNLVQHDPSSLSSSQSSSSSRSGNPFAFRKGSDGVEEALAAAGGVKTQSQSLLTLARGSGARTTATRDDSSLGLILSVPMSDRSKQRRMSYQVDMSESDFYSVGEAMAPTRRFATEELIGPYVVKKTIGNGSFSKVKLGTHLKTKEKVAIKFVSKNRDGDVVQVAREVALLQRLSHPNIIAVLDILETPESICLVLEYAPHSLLEYINSYGMSNRLPEKETRRVFKQLIMGVGYLHDCGVVHRDLKPENVLLDEAKNVKIIDFGLSKGNAGQREMLETACGSGMYAAPEMINRPKYAGRPADMWSVGVILFNMLTGRMPFTEKNAAPLPPHVLYQHAERLSLRLPSRLSAEASDLLTRLMCVNPHIRASIDDVRSHPWFRNKEMSLPTLVVTGTTTPESGDDGSAPEAAQSTASPPDTLEECDVSSVH